MEHSAYLTSRAPARPHVQEEGRQHGILHTTPAHQLARRARRGRHRHITLVEAAPMATAHAAVSSDPAERGVLLPPSPLTTDMDAPVTCFHLCAGIHSLHWAWCAPPYADPTHFKCVGTCESDPARAAICSQLTGHENFPDLARLHEEEGYRTLDYEVQVGGTPCWSFTKRGPGGGLDKASGRLFFRQAQLLRHRPFERRPYMFMGEQVVEVSTIEGGRPLRYLTEALEEVGYVVEVHRLEALDFGSRSARERLYIIAIRRDIFEALGPMPPPTPVTRDRTKQNVNGILVRFEQRKKHEIRPIDDFVPYRVARTDPARVAPERIMCIPGQERNGRLYDPSQPAPTQLGLNDLQHIASGLFLICGRACSLQDEEALELQGMPRDAPFTGRRSIGDAFNRGPVQALGVCIRAYVLRARRFLMHGHTPDTVAHVACSVSAAQAMAATNLEATANAHIAADPRSDEYMLDTGCSHTLKQSARNCTQERPCHIPIGIGDASSMVATSYARTQGTTQEGILIVMPHVLICPSAAHNLCSVRQLTKDNEVDERTSQGITSLITRQGRTVQLRAENGLSFLTLRNDTQPEEKREPPAQERQRIDRHSQPPPRTANHTTVHLDDDDRLTTPGTGEHDDVRSAAAKPQRDATAATKRRYLPLPQLLTRFPVSQQWIEKCDKATVPGASIGSGRTLSYADQVHFDDLEALANQTPKSASKNTMGIGTPTRRGHFAYDAVGPYRLPTLMGSKYSNEFLDAATGFAGITLTPARAPAKPILRDFLMRHVYPHIPSMLSLTCDCCKECGYGAQGSIEFNSFCYEIALRKVHTPPYAHNTNKAERLHYTLTRMQLRLMVQGGAPESFWGGARLCGLECYLVLIGAAATRFCGYPASPRHAFTQEPESATHIRPFLCLVHVLNDKETITMRHLQRNGVAGLMFAYGHTEGVRVYGIYVPGEHSLRWSRNCRFHENVFPFLDGSLMWDPNSQVAVWRFPLYRSRTSLSGLRALGLRINPDIALPPIPALDATTPNTAPRPTDTPAMNAADGPTNPLHLIRATTPTPDPGFETATSPRRKTWAGDYVPGPDGAYDTLSRLINVGAHIEVVRPKPGKNADRFSEYSRGDTLKGMRDRGATLGDLRYDLRHGFIRTTDQRLQQALVATITDQDEFNAFSYMAYQTTDHDGGPPPERYLLDRFDATASRELIAALAEATSTKVRTHQSQVDTEQEHVPPPEPRAPLQFFDTTAPEAWPLVLACAASQEALDAIESQRDTISDHLDDSSTHTGEVNTFSTQRSRVTWITSDLHE